MRFFQCHKQGKVFQPTLVLVVKYSVVPAYRRTGFAIKMAERPVQNAQFPGNHLSKIDLVFGEIWQVIQIAGVEQAILYQRLRADNVSVTGKCRKALVGRVAVPCRSKGKDLPQPAARACQKFEPLMSLWTDIPNTVGTRQAGWVQENA